MKHDREFWTRHVGQLARQRSDAGGVLSAAPAVEGHLGLLGVRR